MTIETAAVPTALPWDHGWHEWALAIVRRQGTPEGQQAAAVDRLTRQVERWREDGWPRMRYELERLHATTVGPEREPHWVGPMSVRLWEHRFHENRTVTGSPDGPVQHVERTDLGWHMTGAMPASTAGQLHSWLERGYRLRPPGMDVPARVAERPAVPGAVAQQWQCSRHRQGTMRFGTWSAYLAHCQHYRELPEGTPPLEVEERARRYGWFCVIHDIGFTSQRAASMHIRWSMRQRPTLVHPTVEQMRVRKEG